MHFLIVPFGQMSTILEPKHQKSTILNAQFALLWCKFVILMKRKEFRQRNLARTTKNFLEYSPKSDSLKEKYFECQELFVARLVACAVPIIICTKHT